MYLPQIDVCERANEIVILVEIPGVDRRDVQISWKDNILTISGHKRRHHGHILTAMSMELVKSDSPPEDQQLKIPDTLPVLPLPDVVVFPYMIVPLFVNRERSAKAVDQSLAENRMIMLVAQKDPNVDDPKAADLRDFGTVSVIMRMLKLPDGRVRILVQGFARAKIEYFDETQPFLMAKVQPRAEVQVVAESVELEALVRNVKSEVEKAVSLGKNLSQD